MNSILASVWGVGNLGVRVELSELPLLRSIPVGTAQCEQNLPLPPRYVARWNNVTIILAISG